MGNTRLNEVSPLINQQIAFQEKVQTCLCKLEALIAVVVLTDNFYDLPKIYLHNYFSVIGDLIEESMEANQQSLHEMSCKKG